MTRTRTAVLIPCFNEAVTIEKVVSDFRAALPKAEIYVFDNNSSDDTAARARAAGATVIREKRRGKGFVVSSMLMQVDADYYIMVDGDNTYPAENASQLLAPLLDGDADMVVGQRLSEHTQESFRRFHLFGNLLVRKVINTVFSANLVDVMSGYRAFTREVAENLPVVASGFDIETEMTLQLLYRNFVIQEIPVPYRERPEGSASKLRTFRDGTLVLLKILGIFKAYKPLTFFGGLAILAALAAVVIGSVVVYEYVQYRYIYSMLNAILAVSCTLLSATLATVGVTLHTVNYRILEMTHVLSKQILRAVERPARPDRAEPNQR
jgi:glycosyltransferase involved in cell wall biosynthesis